LSWSRVALPNPYPCNVAVSPHDPQVMIAKTNGDDHQGYFSLVYRTVDSGTRWEVLKEGLPSVSSIAGAIGARDDAAVDAQPFCSPSFLFGSHAAGVVLPVGLLSSKRRVAAS
jgi:hypothetical protein